VPGIVGLRPASWVWSKWIFDRSPERDADRLQKELMTLEAAT
jgi:hypothetical protein